MMHLKRHTQGLCKGMSASCRGSQADHLPGTTREVLTAWSVVFRPHQSQVSTDLCQVFSLCIEGILFWDSRTGRERRLYHSCCEALTKAQAGSFECCREAPPADVIAAQFGITHCLSAHTLLQWVLHWRGFVSIRPCTACHLPACTPRG